MSFSRTHNEGKHIADIVQRTSCPYHNLPAGVPCWSIYLGEGGGVASAVCNRRVTRAGFNGVIDPKSMRKAAPSGRSNGRVKRPEQKK